MEPNGIIDFLIEDDDFEKYDDYYDGNFEDDDDKFGVRSLAVTLLVIMERDGAANCGCAWRCHLWGDNDIIDFTFTMMKMLIIMMTIMMMTVMMMIMMRMMHALIKHLRRTTDKNFIDFPRIAFLYVLDPHYTPHTCCVGGGKNMSQTNVIGPYPLLWSMRNSFA